MQQRFYSIGEMSKMSNLSIQTLRYYDSIDLFKPIHIDPNSNYRYYDDSQLYQLDLIKALRYLEVPLVNIRQTLEYTLDELVKFLSEQEKVVQSRIERLREVQNTVIKTKKQILEQLSIPNLDEVYEQYEDELRLLAVKIHNSYPENVPNEYFTSLAKKVENDVQGVATRYGVTFPVKKYSTIEEMKYEYLFTPLFTERYVQNLDQDMSILRLAGSMYVCIAFMLSLDNYLERYEQLINYIDEHQYVVDSDVLEYYLPTTYSPHQKQEFIIQLKIKVRKK